MRPDASLRGGRTDVRFCRGPGGWHGLLEKPQVLPSCLHGVDQEFLLAVEAEHDDLEDPARGVEAETELSSWAVLVQVGEEHRALGGMYGVCRIDSVLERRVVDPHAT